MIPSRRLVVLYVMTAHLSLALAFALTAWNPHAVAGFWYHSRMVAIVHLITIGWIAMSILGNVYVVVPMAFGLPFPARKSDYAAYALVVIGLTGMVAHFWLAEFSGMAWSAVTAAAGVAYVVARLAWNLRHARAPGGVKLHLYFASANILAAVTLGVLLGFDKVNQFLPGYVLSNVFAHAHLAAIGWVCMMVVGLGYRLLPMIIPAASPSGPTIYISALLLETGVLGLFVSLVMRSELGAVVRHRDHGGFHRLRRTRRLDAGAPEAAAAWANRAESCDGPRRDGRRLASGRLCVRVDSDGAADVGIDPARRAPLRRRWPRWVSGADHRRIRAANPAHGCGVLGAAGERGRTVRTPSAIECAGAFCGVLRLARRRSGACWGVVLQPPAGSRAGCLGALRGGPAWRDRLSADTGAAEE